ncbi:MAG: hypothetical protein K0R29_2946, partial [Pseudobdellovibrio sp.]|nr:hypothetical protein [Pseudobdellovibrio sp.]
FFFFGAGFFWLFERKFLFFGGDLLLKRHGLLPSLASSALSLWGVCIFFSFFVFGLNSAPTFLAAERFTLARGRFRRRSPPKKRNFLSKSQKKVPKIRKCSADLLCSGFELMKFAEIRLLIILLRWGWRCAT